MIILIFLLAYISFYNWETQTCTSNPSANYQVKSILFTLHTFSLNTLKAAISFLLFILSHSVHSCKDSVVDYNLGNN